VASGSTLSFTAATLQPTVSAGQYFSNYDSIVTAAFSASGADRFTSCIVMVLVDGQPLQAYRILITQTMMMVMEHLRL